MLSGNVIAITSGKGGVGKSTVSVNLALALTRLNKNVALIDLDVYGYSIPTILNLTQRPRILNNKILPVVSHGLSIMSSGFMINGNKPILWRGSMLGKMIEYFFKDVYWGEFDYFIIDMPPGTGDILLELNQLLPDYNEIIVTTPHPAATFVAERTGIMINSYNQKLLGIIENMSYFALPGQKSEKYYIFGKSGGARLANSLNTSLLASLPIAIPDQHGNVPSIFDVNTDLYSHYNELALTIDNLLINTPKIHVNH